MKHDECSVAIDHDAVAAIGKLEVSFGRDVIDGLLADLAATLTEALGSLDRGETDARVAHRVAGIAGTLGFTRASKAWLALSQGVPSAKIGAHLETRRALATLAAR